MSSDYRQYVGIWRLAQVEYDEFDRKGKDGSGDYYRTTHEVVSFDPDFQVNAPVTGDDLAAKLPSGTHIHDTMADVDVVVP